ncbi:MAG: Na(+)-translocating NADH-quinone reductase subunit A [Desulfobulbaceae bacterium]|nr:Na(+)-translocating NADH-quinone reductase subunit A [Desulfobulbaceae bacterium]
MKITINKGLNIPISGEPRQIVKLSTPISHVALLGRDYVGLKPSMLVKVGDRVAAGQTLFIDKKNPGVCFTAPAGGEVVAINRGARRLFESLVIRVEGDDRISFPPPTPINDPQKEADSIREMLVSSGLWTALQTRPFGKVPNIQANPAAIFVTAMDTLPLAANPETVIGLNPDLFTLGLQKIQTLAPKTYLCAEPGATIPGQHLPGILTHRFAGPHPAGLPSTHIHFLSPIRPGKEVWHINYQDIMAIGHLFRTGFLPANKVISLAGPAIKTPRLLRTLPGAAIHELCANETTNDNYRLISGSVLTGHRAEGSHSYLGRYHQQVSALSERDGSGLFNWLRPGWNRYSCLPIFLSACSDLNYQFRKTVINTATWGGKRSIFPLGTYEKVMPLDIIATSLLKSLVSGNNEKSVELGCLELVEEDLALCSFVCPGKNNFGPMLRRVLNAIEEEG